jgi:formylmethanofuran dehydrogenase subunit E
MSFYITDDPIADFDRYDTAQAKRLERLPKCDLCGAPIYERYYLIGTDKVCPDCLENEYGREVDLDE